MGANLMGVNDAATGHAPADRHRPAHWRVNAPTDAATDATTDRHIAMKKPALGRF